MKRLKQIVAWFLTVSIFAGNNLPVFASTEDIFRNLYGNESVISGNDMLNSTNKVTPSDAEKKDEETGHIISKVTASNADEEVVMWNVNYEVVPFPDAAEVKGEEEIRDGQSEKFKVIPAKGWDVDYIYAEGEELEGIEKRSLTGKKTYVYELNNVTSDISVEVHMKENNKSFSAIAGDAEISLSEIKKNTLKNVDYIEVEETEIPDIEDVLKDNLNNQEIADYKAFDITLFNESGDEIEPDGDVSVNIKNIYTDAEYDDVKIFHLMESNAYALNDDRAAYSDGGVYKVEEVSKSVKDRIDTNNEISFKAESFSKYLIVFIKNPVDYKILNLVFKKEIAEGQYEDIDLGEKNLSIGIDTTDHNPRIVDILEAHSIGEVSIGGEEYTYERAFYYENGQEKDVSIINKTLYDAITGLDDEIYVVYKNKKDVYVGAMVRCFSDIDKGRIDHELLSQLKVGHIAENRPLEAGFVFEKAYVEKTTISGGQSGVEKIEINGIKKIGPYIYYKTVNGRNSRLFYEDGEEKIVLEYVPGKILSVDADYEDGSQKNSYNNIIINGKTYSLPLNNVITLPDSDSQIIINIAQGYDIEITGLHTFSSIKEFEEKGIHVRKHIINIGANDDLSTGLAIKFKKSGKTLDFSYLVNKNGSHENLHNSDITIQQGAKDNFDDGQKFADEDDKSHILNITDGNDVKITIESNKIIDQSYFVMNAFAVNGKALNIPDDPKSANDNNSESDGEIKDENNEVIARYSIQATYVPAKYFWNTNKRVYVITFKDIAASLKVTNANLKGEEHKELLIKSIGEGIKVEPTDENGNTSGNDEKVKENDVFAFPKDSDLYFKIIAEEGYYVESVAFEDNIGKVVEPAATNLKNVYKLNNTDFYDNALFKLNINSEKINYHFKYWNDNTLVKDATQETFNLTNNENNTGNVNCTLNDISESQKFAGWKLDKAEDIYYLNGNTIPKERIITAGSFNEENVKEKAIDLYAYYAAQLSEHATKYYVVVSIEGKAYGKPKLENGIWVEQPVKPPYDVSKLFGPEDGIVGDIVKIDERFLEGTVSGNSIVEIYEKNGYIIDAGENNNIKLTEKPEQNIFTIHLVKKIKNVNVAVKGAGEVTVNVNDDSIANPVTKTIDSTTNNFNFLCSEGDKLIFTVKESDRDRINQIYIDGKVLSNDERNNLLNPQNGFTVGLKTQDSREHSIIFYFDSTRSIKYESGIVDKKYITGMPANQDVEIGKSFSLANPSANGYTFNGWKSSHDGNTYNAGKNFKMPDKDLVLTAQWTPVYTENYWAKVIFSVENGKFDDNTDANKEVYVYKSDDQSGKLSQGQIPSAGQKPNNGYKAGSWNKIPSVDTAITRDTTYIYKYAEDYIQTDYWVEFVFKAVNGSFEDGLSKISKYVYRDGAGKAVTLKQDDIPNPANPNPGYKNTGSWYPQLSGDITANKKTTYTYTFEPDLNTEYWAKVTFTAVNGTFDDGSNLVETYVYKQDKQSGKLIKGQIPNAGQNPNSGYTAGSWDKTPSVNDVITVETTYTYSYAEDANGNGKADDKETKYTLTYTDGVATEEVFVDESHQLIENVVIPKYNNGVSPTRAGYVFTGWQHSVDGKVYTAVDGLIMPKSDLTLTAQWSEDANGNGIPDRDESKNNESSENNRIDGLGSSESNPILNIIDGHWMHVDPNDNFKEISVPVPYDKTPSEAPEYHRWKFILNNGTMIYNKKVYIKNPYAQPGQPSEGWFYFDNNGIMQFGWHFDNGKWYYLHADSDGMLGTRIEGWHFDKQDNRWYYLKPRTGEMLISWQFINGKWFYFNINAPKVTWNYDATLSKWIFNGSKHRPYGSMYANENTPDGYFVGKDGALVK